MMEMIEWPLELKQEHIQKSRPLSVKFCPFNAALKDILANQITVYVSGTQIQFYWYTVPEISWRCSINSPLPFFGAWRQYNKKGPITPGIFPISLPREFIKPELLAKLEVVG